MPRKGPKLSNYEILFTFASIATWIVKYGWIILLVVAYALLTISFGWLKALAILVLLAAIVLSFAILLILTGVIRLDKKKD